MGSLVGNDSNRIAQIDLNRGEVFTGRGRSSRLVMYPGTPRINEDHGYMDIS